MNKTIYIRDEDAPVWDRAREHAGDKLSPVIMDSLKRFVAERDAAPKGFERIEVRYLDAEEHDIPKAKAFYGRWIYPPEEPVTTSDDFRPDYHCYAVAITAKGKVVIYDWMENNEGRWGQYFEVFESLEDAAVDGRIGYAARRAMEKIGVPVEELDI